jgi:serine/threonine-protein kinase
LTYLEAYLLKQVETPVVICLNEVNRIFDYPALAEEFLQLLHLLDQQSTSSASLANLRLVLVYSSELYLPRQPNQSRPNVGVLVELPEFTLGEIQFLARQYRLDWGTGLQPALALYNEVGGHPYLVQLALHHLATRRPTLDISSSATVLMQLLEQAPTLMGIYSEHLQRLLSVLYTHPDLIPTLSQVLQHTNPLNLVHTDKLQSLGLIKFTGNRAVIRCNLYQHFFSAHLFHQRQSLVDSCSQG